ncbi:tetratricopeptide repeat protein [uncultured Roseibium sp.]|uniref:tetratricopeptide repeat protein n=2 Tax=uncultured Roseibium sp. TaxID=1936171 RepID=UPI0026155C1B|nr:tetratricopeptide repeat protein [uncultured Roseibium sp.]
MTANASATDGRVFPGACERETEETRQMNCLFEEQGIPGVLELAEKAEAAADLEFAFDLYEFASRKGSPVASYNVGVFYEEGGIVEQSTEKAIEYYSESAAADFVPAFFNLGNIFCRDSFSENKKDCAYWLLKAFQAGDLDAGYNLAMYLVKNETDLDWAEVLLNMAAEQGHEPSASFLDGIK